MNFSLFFRLRGKDLQAIQRDWEQTENDLTDFIGRKQGARESLQATIDALCKKHDDETQEQKKANIFLDNLKTLRTQSLRLAGMAGDPPLGANNPSDL